MDSQIKCKLEEMTFFLDEMEKSFQEDWSEPLRVDNELSNINSWREVYEKDEATLRPSIQDISSSRT